MSKIIKTKIVQLLENIEDETILNQVMEDVTFYTSKKDIIDDLNVQQKKELDEAIKEADNKDTIPWKEFKDELNEWKKK